MLKEILISILIELKIDCTNIGLSNEAFVEKLLAPGKLDRKLPVSSRKVTSFIKTSFPDKKPYVHLKTYLLAKKQLKQCNNCSEVLDFKLFTVANNKTDGLSSTCRSCHSNEQKNYYQNNSYAQVARVRKRKDKLDRALSKKEIDYIFTKYNKVCAFCGYSNIDHNIDYGQNLHLDHIVPFSKGGKTEVSNMQLLCRSCNSKKGVNE